MGEKPGLDPAALVHAWQSSLTSRSGDGACKALQAPHRRKGSAAASLASSPGLPFAVAMQATEKAAADKLGFTFARRDQWNVQ